MKTNEKGFTLIEVLISVVILSASLITIYRPLLGSVSAIHYTDSRIEGNRIISEKLWRIQQDVYDSGVLTKRKDKGEIIGNERVYNFKFDTNALEIHDYLVEASYQLNWISSGRKKSIRHTSYITRPVIDEE